MQPRPPQLLIEKGTEAYRAGRYPQAIGFLTEFTERYARHPRHANAVRMLSSSLIYAGRRAEALAVLDRAVGAHPQDPEFDLIRGHALRLTGDHDGAGAAYERCLTADPRIAIQATAALAEVRTRQGRSHEARDLVDRALAQGHQSPRLDLARGMLALSSGQGRAGAIDALLAREREGTIEPELLPVTLCAIGDLLDAEGRYDEAFAHYRACNEAAAETFDPEAAEQRIGDIIAAWPAERVRELQRWGDPSDRPVLIVGTPRSGTTLTEQLLGRHPQVAKGGELKAWRDAVHALTPVLGAPLHERADRVGQAEVRATASSYLGALDAVSPTARRVTDKMPMNLLQLGLFAAVFPNARVIHCRRDPRDAALSCYFRNFMQEHPWSTRLDWLGRFFLQYLRIMEHWRSVLAAVGRPQLLELRYERVVADPDRCVREMVAFVGLAWDPACSAPEWAVTSDAPTLRADQVGKGVYQSSRGKHARYAPHIEPLTRMLSQAAARYESESAEEAAGVRGTG